MNLAQSTALASDFKENQPNRGPWGILIFFALPALFIGLALVASAEEFPPLLPYFFVLGITLFMLHRVLIRPIDLNFPIGVLAFALLVRLLSATFRYWTVIDLYEGRADALAYHLQGEYLSEFLRTYEYSILEHYRYRGEGTTSLAIATGFLYSVLPISFVGASFFFTLLSFVGSTLFYAALRVAWPHSWHQAYFILVFFLPSILFWPSSLGKDAWVFVCSGLIVFAWAKLPKGRPLFYLALIAASLATINLVRPHVAAIQALAMTGAFLIAGTGSRRSIFTWVAAAGVMLLVVVYAVQSGVDFLQLDTLSVESVQEFYDDQQESTHQGGSRYETASVFTPTGFLVGLFTALIRPFPWEAHNAQALVASLETMIWLAFCIRQRRVFLRKIRTIRRDPMVAFALFFSIAMLLALTSLGNFGLLARQRVMVLPFLWMLFV